MKASESNDTMSLFEDKEPKKFFASAQFSCPNCSFYAFTQIHNGKRWVCEQCGQAIIFECKEEKK